MAHPHLVKDIALQAGVSVATVDRVLNQRAGVRQHTQRRVAQALAELERQSAQVGLVGRKFLIDVVMQAPDRFTQVARAALERELPALQPAIFRSRFHLAELTPVSTLVTTLDSIAARGSHGVLLKAPDLPEVVAAVQRLHVRGIPVITLVTDLPTSQRLAYVGMDNRAAGQTAAYLMGEWLGETGMRGGGEGGSDNGTGVVVSLSSNRFRGEEEREIGFRQTLRERYPALNVHEISEGFGLHSATAQLLGEKLKQWPDAVAVYSVGGANAAIIEAFERQGRACRIFIGHDLDADNLRLLRQGRLSAVLHHDLQHDMRTACLHVMRAHGALAPLPLTRSSVQVITPYNLPEAFGT